MESLWKTLFRTVFLLSILQILRSQHRKTVSGKASNIYIEMIDLLIQYVDMMLIRCRHINSVSWQQNDTLLTSLYQRWYRGDTSTLKRYRHRVTDSDGFVNTKTIMKNDVETMHKLWLIFYRVYSSKINSVVDLLLRFGAIWVNFEIYA